MKKTFFLTSLCLSMAAVALADTDYVTPREMYDVALQRVSRNGAFAVGQDSNGSVVYTYDISADKIYEYPSFSIGNGNCVADNGMVVGQNLGSLPQGAVMWNGQSYVPPTLKGLGSTALDGITPDGRRAVGYHSNATGVLYTPFVVDIAEDGTFGTPVNLPYPRKDFFKDTPQFVNAISISDDGKMIAGFVQDGSGFYSWPIVYRQNLNGTWSYTEPTARFFNPDGLPTPTYPTDGVGLPKQPDFKDYMTADEYEAWLDACEINPDASPFDFMSDGEYAAYNAAIKAYNAALQDYYKLIDDYWHQMYLMGRDEQYMLNMLALSPDGKTLAVAKGHSNEESTTDVMASVNICLFNLDDDSFVEMPSSKGLTLMPKQILADGTLIAVTTTSDFIPFVSYMLMPGAEDFISFMEFLEEMVPSYYPWLEDSILTNYGVIGYDDDGQEIIGQYTITGYVSISDDYKVIAGGYPLDPAYSYVYVSDKALDISGVEEMAAEAAAPAGGDDAYYNLQGIRVSDPKGGVFIHNGKKVLLP